MSFGKILTSVGRAFSRLPWKDIGKSIAVLASVAGKVYLDSKNFKLTNTPQPERDASYNRIDKKVLKFIDGQNMRIQRIEQAIQELQFYNNKQAKVIADIAEQMTTIDNVMHTLSVRLNIFISLALVALGISLAILLLNFVHS